MHITSSEYKQKIISTAIVTIGAFLGFQALSYVLGLYQISSYVWMSIYIYAFHVFWLTFLFDLHFKKKPLLAEIHLSRTWAHMLWGGIKDRVSHMLNWHYFRHYQNFLILPGIIYWSVVVLLFLNPFANELKQLIIASSTLALGVVYWHFKEVFSKNLEAHEWSLHILALAKLFAAFLIYSAVFGVTRYYGFGLEFLGLAVFAMTFLLVYQALFQHKLLSFNVFFFILLIASIVSIASVWVYFYWNTNYLTGGLVMLAVYNSLWGMLHHHLDNNLTCKLVVEYLLMLVFALSILFTTHDFSSRIG